MNIINGINSPDDIKKLNIPQLRFLAAEIRDFLIENISNTGGHLASNLGIVELTLALHKVFTTPEDRIVWDVGHQSYVHKIITGRKKRFETLRKYDGLSGFPKISESRHDGFGTGHSSTAVSAALGIARARDLQKSDYSVIAVVGDGALTGGLSYEALNDAGHSKTKLIVILNDNGMSIAKNVGGISKYLSRIRTQPIYYKVKKDLDIFLGNIPYIGKKASILLNRAKGSIKFLIIPGMIFEELGFEYLGPIDGHDINELLKVLSRARHMKGPVLIHICTKKGKGYPHAEAKPDEFHGISPFEIETGELKTNNGPSWSDELGRYLEELGRKDMSITAITAAMPHGTGLIPFSKAFPDRFFDVGIAEQHAVTLAAGMAANGLKPVVAVYSTFLQRAYDQIIHDVAIQGLHVVFAVDRAGNCGEDGETHHGIYDISFLRHIPSISIMSPADSSELAEMLKIALFECKGPAVIRYPKGETADKNLSLEFPMSYGKGAIIREGTDVTVIAAGCMLLNAIAAADILDAMGISAEVMNPRFLKPLDSGMIIDSVNKTRALVTIEDNTATGGFGSSVLELLSISGNQVPSRILGFPDVPVCQGTRQQLFVKYGLDVHSIVEAVKELIYNNFQYKKLSGVSIEHRNYHK